MQWLEDAIQYAVQRLDKAPFLELVHPESGNTQCDLHPVTQAVVESPQVRYRPRQDLQLLQLQMSYSLQAANKVCT